MYKHTQYICIYIYIDVCLGNTTTLWPPEIPTSSLYHVYDSSNPLRGPQPFPCWILLEVDIHLVQQDLSQKRFKKLICWELSRFFPVLFLAAISSHPRILWWNNPSLTPFRRTFIGAPPINSWFNDRRGGAPSCVILAASESRRVVAPVGVPTLYLIAPQKDRFFFSDFDFLFLWCAWGGFLLIIFWDFGSVLWCAWGGICLISFDGFWWVFSDGLGWTFQKCLMMFDDFEWIFEGFDSFTMNVWWFVGDFGGIWLDEHI